MSARAQASKVPLSSPPSPVAVAQPAKTEWVQRFTLATRIEHWSMVVIFTMLCLTGLPQKYASSDWAVSVTNLFAGANTMRVIHRVFGWLMSIATVFHLVKLAVYVLKRKGPLHMMANRRDFTDAIGTLKYYLGMQRHHPPYDRYDYKQKFEYWGMLMGSLLMVATGFILLYPVEVASLLPGQAIPVAKVAHSNEGLMAFLVIVVWHIYNAVLAPEVFPIDKTMFTGKISRERMEHEHSLELERLEGKKSGPEDSHP